MILFGQILSHVSTRAPRRVFGYSWANVLRPVPLWRDIHKTASWSAPAKPARKPRAKKPKSQTAKSEIFIPKLLEAPKEDTAERKGIPFDPSPEQLEIIDLLKDYNVVVSARPGAGKTATAHAIVAANPHLRTLILTYSKRLQLETKLRLVDYPSCGVFTFHGFATKLFGETARTDAVLYRLRREGKAPEWTDEPYDIVILDEIQDCTEILYWLICTSVIAMTRAANGKAPRLVVLGDERQAIHEYRAADPRYLTHARDSMQALTPYLWKSRALSKSFRLSKQCARFINKAFLGGIRYIVGSHLGLKPIYLHIDQWEAEALASELLPLIQKYGAANTAILSMSVDKNPTVSKFTNILTERFRIPVAAPISDDFPLDDKVVHDKLCVSTFHQFKGNERDLVIVYGMDNSYFMWGAKDTDSSICPNAIFVAITRAKKQLVIIHDSKNPALPFISVPYIHKTATYVNIGAPGLIENTTRSMERFGLNLPTKIHVSKMAKHIVDDVLQNIIDKHLTVTVTQPSLQTEHHIKSPDVVLSDKMRGHHEAVSDLNGIAIVAAYEQGLLGTLYSLGLWNLPSKFPTGIQRAAWFCKKACEYDATISTYRSRLLQLKNHPFDWLGPYLDQATERLKSHLTHRRSDLAFEVPLDSSFSIDSHKTEVVGRADIVATEEKGEKVTVWEIKCVTELSPTHIIQVCSYGYLWAITRGSKELPCMKLYNVRNGEEWTIESKKGVKGIKALIEAVLRVKHTRQEPVPTEDFVRRCEEVRAEVEAMFDKPVMEDNE